MKINRNKGNLQSQLAKMLQAGMENVESEQKSESQSTVIEGLRASEQAHNNTAQNRDAVEAAQNDKKDIDKTTKSSQSKKTISQGKKTIKKTAKSTVPSKRTNQKETVKPRTQTSGQDESQPRLNAAQRHEVPDHNAKYAGEPIKSVGCRMPQSLYARMLQYKAFNDTQVNRITLNDIIIEAVEKFMDENE